MQSIKETPFYSEVRKVLNLPYGDFYFFDHFLVSEIKEDILFTWDHAKPVVIAASTYYGNSGDKIIYISNRINKYTVKPVDWLRFVSYSFKLGGYGIVTDSDLGARLSIMESLFVPTKIKTFNNLIDAFQWAATLQLEES